MQFVLFLNFLLRKTNLWSRGNGKKPKRSDQTWGIRRSKRIHCEGANGREPRLESLSEVQVRQGLRGLSNRRSAGLWGEEGVHGETSLKGETETIHWKTKKKEGQKLVIPLFFHLAFSSFCLWNGRFMDTLVDCPHFEKATVDIGIRAWLGNQNQLSACFGNSFTSGDRRASDCLKCLNLHQFQTHVEPKKFKSEESLDCGNKRYLYGIFLQIWHWNIRGFIQMTFQLDWDWRTLIFQAMA